MTIIDYIYYRVCNWYRSRNDTTAEIRSLMVIGILIFSILFDAYIIIDNTYHLPSLSKWLAIPTLVFLFIILHYRYNKLITFDALSKKINKEDDHLKKRNGFLIVLLLGIVVLIPIITGILKHNRF